MKNGVKNPRDARDRRDVSILVLLVLFVPCLSPQPARAQDDPFVSWSIPPEKITLDFSDANPQRRVVFRPQGMAYELPLNLVMLKHNKIEIGAAAPEAAGTFEIEITNPKAKLKIERSRVENGRCLADLVVSIPSLSITSVTNAAQARVDAIRDEAQQAAEAEAKKTTPAEMRSLLTEKKIPVPGGEQALRDEFKGVRADELKRKATLERLEALAEKRDAWFSPNQRDGWAGKTPEKLLEEYRVMSVFDLTDQYLLDCGFQFDANQRAYRNFLLAKLDGIYAVTSGRTLRQEPPPGTAPQPETDEQRKQRLDAIKAVGGLEAAELAHLRDLITAPLVCRFFPATDPQDANSQWFLGQRISGKAFGVQSIRVHGKLHAAARDRIDWWRLEGFDPVQVELVVPKSETVRIDPPFISSDGVRLRVTAVGNGPCDYSFTFKPKAAATGTANVVIHETPSNAAVKFPF